MLGPQKQPKSVKAIEAEINQVKAEIDYILEKEGREHPDLKAQLKELEDEFNKLTEQERLENFIKSTDLYKQLIDGGFIVDINDGCVSVCHPSIIHTEF